jgi:hypothetical protein
MLLEILIYSERELSSCSKEAFIISHFSSQEWAAHTLIATAVIWIFVHNIKIYDVYDILTEEHLR